MAKARWTKDRAERNRQALLMAEQFPSRIVRRIVVIDDERDVREVTIWNWESGRDWKRKERRVLARRMQ
jgi:alkyl hydroperoxide reductase subunit AhpC